MQEKQLHLKLTDAILILNRKDQWQFQVCVCVFVQRAFKSFSKSGLKTTNIQQQQKWYNFLYFNLKQ